MKARSRLGSRANGLVASRSRAISQHPFANSKPNRLAGLKFSPARRSEDGSLLADPSFAGEDRSLIPASFFEKKQAIDNATKVANFGTLYWAHLRLGRLNGRNFIASRADFGGNPFTWRRRVASSPLDRHAAWPIGTLLPAAPRLTNWSFT